MKPTIGRIVHYVEEGGTHKPAIITSVGEKTVNLSIFHDGGSVGGGLEIPFSEKPKEGTWHWAEVVKEGSEK